jgi:hypothetical protein
MKHILDLPNEVILLVFEKTTFPTDVFALSKTCRHFLSLCKQHERSLSIEIAAQGFLAPYRVLGFGGRSPSLFNLLVLVDWTTEIAEFIHFFDVVRRASIEAENTIWRAVWFTPLWQEHFQVGLLLYKKLSLSGSVVERLERLAKLPHQFHALLRFTSIITSDLIRVHTALGLGEPAMRQLREFWQGGFAPGDNAPWLRNDVTWRAMEILLFENGYCPFLELMTRTDWSGLVRRHDPRERSILNDLKYGRLSHDRHYHLRLDELCLAYGRVWGGREFWRDFDPFRLKDSGLSGSDATEEMVKHLQA